MRTMKLDRRMQILDAAATLISERGFTATSVDDVIKGAKLSGKSHFYHYFKSKEELGYEVLNRQFERFADRGLAILREPMIDPLERLSLFIDAIVALQAESGGRRGSPFGNMAAELADAHEGFRVRIEAVFERWASQIRSLLWEARPQLRDDTDAVRLARFIIATLEGAVLMTRVKRDMSMLEGIAMDLKRFIHMHVKDGALPQPGPDAKPASTAPAAAVAAAPPAARRASRSKTAVTTPTVVTATTHVAPGDGTW
jgi:TetR/AcrR family transcriptional repressor of nem operon